jgi:uncharacterized protein (DUF983 family)
MPPSGARPLRTLTVPVLLWRGLWRRCPQCGSSGCFETWFRIRERCPRCHFPLQREEGFWIGGIGMNTVVTFGLVGLSLLVSFVLTWDDRRGVAVFVPAFAVAAIVPLAFFGSSLTLWSAIHLAMTPVQPADDIDLDWLSPVKRRR